MNDDEIRKYVRERYAEIATGDMAGEHIANAEELSCCALPETDSTTSC